MILMFVTSAAFERLHAACSDGDLEAVKAVLCNASQDQRTVLLRQQGRTEAFLVS